MPLDAAHASRLMELARAIGVAAGLPKASEVDHPHITLVAHTGLSPDDAQAAIGDVAATTRPFLLRAHGYGFFTGDEESEITLHVPVVRSRALDELHQRLDEALRRAGADVAGWTAPALWSPHITLLDRGLDPAALGAAVTWLAARHHSSWRLGADRIALTGGRTERHRAAVVMPLGGSRNR